MKTNRIKTGLITLSMVLLTYVAVAQSEGGALTDMPKYGVDSAKCVENLSLYKDFYNQWKASKYTNNELAEDALKSWSYCIWNCPAASINMYQHGIDLIKNYKLKTIKDSLLADKYVDTLMMIYDQRIKYFGNHPTYDVGYIKGRKAIDLMEYRESKSVEYFPIFKESVQLKGNNSEAVVLIKYFSASYKYYKQGNAPIDLVMETYLDIVDIVDYNTQTGAKDSTDYAAVNTSMEKAVVQLFKCEKLVEIFEPKLVASPNDIDLSRKIVKIFEKRKCTSQDLYYKALANVHAKSPSPESAFSMGKMAAERKEWSKAKTYLQEAAESYPDSLRDKIANSYLLLSEVLRNMDSYSAARTAAYNALKYRPGEAQAYIIIGDLYMASANSCTYKEMPVSYWAAADKYVQAINMTSDEKIKASAQERLNNARRRFPAAADLFQRVLTEGSSFTVECWINETTTVRAR